MDQRTPLWDDFLTDAAAIYRWSTQCLEHLLTLSRSTIAPDIHELVVAEVDRRSRSHVEELSFHDLSIPIVVTNGRMDAWSTPGLMFWFGLRESPSETPALRVRRLWTVAIESNFRASVDLALRQCPHSEHLFLDIEHGPLFSDDPLSGESASLPAAVWAGWYLNGVWPEEPLAISGRLDQHGRVHPVLGIPEKLAGARGRGVPWLVVPQSPSSDDPEGLIAVSCDPPYDTLTKWVERCESILLAHGIRMQPHPRLRKNWAEKAHRLTGGRDEFAQKISRLADRADEHMNRSLDLERRLHMRLREYTRHYESFCSREQLDAQLKELRQVLESSPPNRNLSLRVARLHLACGLFEDVVSDLEPYTGDADAECLRILGTALTKLHEKSPENEDYLLRGRTYLEQALEADPDSADAAATLAGTYRKADSETARKYYAMAHEQDPSDPYPLGNLVEFEMHNAPPQAVIERYRESLDQATERCLFRINVGNDGPWPYFDLGKFAMWMGRDYESLGAYMRGALAAKAPWQIDSALKSLIPDTTLDAPFVARRFARRTLKLVNTIRHSDAQANHTSVTVQPPVIIVCGHCASELPNHCSQLMREVFGGYSGTLISGGTTSGISGMVGELAESTESIHAIGYLPKVIPGDVYLDSRYSEHRRSTSEKFSPDEPLTYWQDIFESGINPQQVRLFVIGGGALTAFECQLALAVRASVVCVEHQPGTAIEKLMTDPLWHAKHPNIEQYPPDADDQNIARIRRALLISKD
jgi:tetratricopeptide (TPR) repeat protein